jgi:hypothetical protein
MLIALLLSSLRLTGASSATSEDLHHAAMLRRAEVSILGESALLDRDSGRVYWEGGSSNTLYESLVPTLDKYGAEHAQAAILSALITLAFLGVLAGWTRHALDHQTWMTTAGSATGTTASIVSAIVTVLQFTILRMPTMQNRWLVAASIALYFLESYNCSTRRFLTNSMTSTEELEAYIDKLREEQPIVAWNVITYHFERRKIFALTSLLRTWIRKGRRGKNLGVLEDIPRTKKCRSMFPFTRKVISHVGTSFYQYGGYVEKLSIRHHRLYSREAYNFAIRFLHKSLINCAFSSSCKSIHRCEDNTIAGVWRRAEALSNGVAPFTKIALTKILVLSDRKSREDYFKQQSEFVAEHSRGDEFVQFSTNIEGEFKVWKNYISGCFVVERI